MELTSSRIEGAGFIGEARAEKRVIEAEKIFRFLRFFNAPPDRVAEILFRDALVRFGTIRTNACSATNELTNQAIVPRITGILVLRIARSRLRQKSRSALPSRRDAWSPELPDFTLTRISNLADRDPSRERCSVRALTWNLRFGASLELGGWSLELHLSRERIRIVSRNHRRSIRCRRRPFSWARPPSSVRLASALRSVCMRTSSACVVK